MTYGWLQGGGTTGGLIQARDWSSSPLGPPDGWPQSLRSVVGLMLGSKFPMFVAWGPEFGFLYNDAYGEILGAKHPAALGARFHDIWTEIWDDISPLIEAAMRGEASYLEDLPLTMNRRGYDEETWFTFSYSPLRDESGQVAGMFCAVVETTNRVRAEAQVREGAEQLRLATEAAEVGFWDYNPRTGVLDGPARTKQMFGFAPDAEVSIQETYRSIHPEDHDRVSAAFAAAVDPARRALYDVEYRAVSPTDARVRWIAAKGRAHFDAADTCVRVVGTAVDITVRKAAEEHLRLMVNELNHRVKNSLATVQAIVSQTLRRGEIPEAVRNTLVARLVALAAAHDVLTGERWTGADLRQLAEQAASPYQRLDGGGPFVIDGPPAFLPPKTAIALALAFHELATNAAKYGALTAPDGRVTLRWTVTPGDLARRLRLVWTEAGGPLVQGPRLPGFGTRLLQQGLAAELNGEVQLDFRPEGLVCVMDARLADEPQEDWQVDFQFA